MRKNTWLAGGAGVLAVLLLGAQFIPVPRTNPPVEQDVPAPPAVKAILRASCYDCHSNETVWPWYSRVAPVSWLVSSDTEEGRSRLNFSTWNQYTPEQQAENLAQALLQIKKGEMPPWFYTIKHTEGKLTPEKQALLEAWATARPQ